MKCDLCQKKATVHLTEIIDHQIVELHLCEDCAREKSAQMEQQFGLADLLAGLSDFGSQIKDQEKEKIVCPNCAMSYDDFKKFGRLGCGDCYTAFKTHLSVLLKKIHGANYHHGKTPGLETPSKNEGQNPQNPPQKPLDVLKAQLQNAIQEENFEKAAGLRDKIRTLEKEV